MRWNTLAVSLVMALVIAPAGLFAQDVAAPAEPSAAPATTAPSAPPAALPTDKEQVSYTLGLEIGQGLRNLPIELDLDAMMLGVRHTIENTTPLMTEAQVVAIREALSRRLQRQYMQQIQEMGAQNQQAADEFLAQNRGAEGVRATPTGLQYSVIREGQGDRPDSGDSVTVHYRGAFLNGQPFDSSYDRGEPVTFQLDQVIPGWSEGVQLMRTGAQYRFWVPPHLAYGEAGRPPVIPPNALLVFEVELLEVQDTPAGADAQRAQ